MADEPTVEQAQETADAALETAESAENTIDDHIAEDDAAWDALQSEILKPIREQMEAMGKDLKELDRKVSELTVKHPETPANPSESPEVIESVTVPEPSPEATPEPEPERTPEPRKRKIHWI